MSCGAVVFHWARRDRVLLRDILRLGTATSALLPRIRYGGPVRGWFGACLRVAVLGSRIRKPDATLGAQPRAVIGAQRRERQFEHERIAQGRLKIEQIPVQKVPVNVVVARLVDEQLGEPDLGRRREHVQTPRTLADQRRLHGRRHQYALGDALKLDIQLELGTFRNVNQLDAQTSRSWRRAGLRSDGTRTKGPGIEYERHMRVQPL